jgi:hypothetical protein
LRTVFLREVVFRVVFRVVFFLRAGTVG